MNNLYRIVQLVFVVLGVGYSGDCSTHMSVVSVDLSVWPGLHY